MEKSAHKTPIVRNYFGDQFSLKSEIKRRGFTQSQIAQNYGVSPQAISNAIVMPCRAGEEALAQFFDLTPETLFPDRYSAVEPDYNRANGTRARQNDSNFNGILAIG